MKWLLLLLISCPFTVSERTFKRIAIPTLIVAWASFSVAFLLYALTH